MITNFTVILKVIVVCCITMDGSDGFSFTSFTKDIICDTQSRLVKKCTAKKEEVYRTQTDCAYECLQDSGCIGVSLGEGFECFHHFTCAEHFTCGVGVDMLVYKRGPTTSTAGSDAARISASPTTTVVAAAAEPEITMTPTTNETSTTTTATTPPTTTTETTPTTTVKTTLPPTTTTTPPTTSTTATTRPTTTTHLTTSTTPSTTITPSTTTTPPTTSTTTTTRPTTTTHSTTTATTPTTKTTPTTTTHSTTTATTSTTKTTPTTTTHSTTTATTPTTKTTPTTTTHPTTSTTRSTTTTPPTTSTTATTRPTTTTHSTTTATTPTTKTTPTTTTATPTTRSTTTARTIKTCKNSGIWDGTTWKCVCSNGWVGDTCEKRARGCQDLADYGYSRGWPPHWVYIDVEGFSSPLYVRCQLKDTHYTLYMMINQGKIDSPNKTWNDYENGYTLDNYKYHYWMGLKAMKILNEVHKTVYLETTFIYPNDTTILQYRYDDFQLNKASNGYKFTFSQSIPSKFGTYSDRVQHSSCLDSLQGGSFSTWDRDDDGDSGNNCAAQSGVGWWYKGCNMVCNPLGLSYEVFPSSQETKRHIKMAGLDYKNGVYAKQVAATMYFLAGLT